MPPRNPWPPRAACAALCCLGLAALSAAGQTGPAEPARALRSGPMLGYSELTEVAVWLQTWSPRRVQLRFWQEGRPETARLSREVTTGPEGDHIARFTLSDLAFGTRHAYEVYLDGQRVPLPYPTVFQTQHLWRWRTDPPPLRLAVGSCAYVNEPVHDRPGEPYGGGYEIFAAILARAPDLMLWLGDNVYYREADWLTESAMRRRLATDRALPDLQPLLAAVHHYALWDDHDYGPDNSDRSFRGREASLRVFRDYWPNPGGGTAETLGIFTRFEWGDVEVFLLDGRFHRWPQDFPDSPAKGMYGREQLQWLEEALLSSTATFKLVAGGSQFLSPVLHREGLAHYPREQKELLDFLAGARVNGVVFLSGDHHHTELLRRDRPGLYPLYEFSVSPLTAGSGVHDQDLANPARIPGTLVPDRNFGLIEVSGPAGDRRLTLVVLDAAGEERWRREIREVELTAAGKPR